MTKTQQLIVGYLMDGCSIANALSNGYRLRDLCGRVILKVNPRTFNWLKKYGLIRKCNTVFVIDKRTVRAMHGNSLIKKAYRNKLKCK